MRSLIQLLGFLALIAGLLWIGQGLGYIKWPEGSYMINNVTWSYYGGGSALLGIILIWLSKR